jgi:outer membrane protein OmpA-like peptidoglycan-associated protein
MINTQTMLDAPSGFRSLYWPVAIILAVLLALLWFMGFGPGGLACKRVAAAVATDAPVAPVAAPAEPAVAPAPAAPAPALAAAPGLEKLYFATSSSDVDAASKAKLGKIVEYLKANPAAVVLLSGFHDPSGNKAQNEELALNRARAVRAALGEAGIAKERVEMAKPIETTGGGAPEEARRVEVSIKR